MVDEIAAVTLAVGALAWLVWRGFFTPPGSFGSWAMFSHTNAYRVRLYDAADGRPVCPWTYELRHGYLNSVEALGDLVRYLEEEHGTRVTGDGVALMPFTAVRIAIRNGRVVRA
ncbi:hypothetical protein [Streptomyces sp. NPDC050982]|uniref:hypothetical protein n=1 Tax=Streptomyces sp. NPDC050982 TaxID=3154746 RepID=UPI0033C347BD